MNGNGGYSKMRQVRAVERYMSNLADTLDVLERRFQRLRDERDRLKTRLYRGPGRDPLTGRFKGREVTPAGDIDGLLNDVLPES